jgi:GntR family transcriptional regulator
MRFWFEHSSDVPLREQIVTQITLGILSGELAAGERLPSIRDLARRFGLHANTVSAGYRQLEAEGWVATRRGSGCYVRDRKADQPSFAPPDVLARAIGSLFHTASRLGIPASEVVDRVCRFAENSAVDRILLVEPDEELRRIVLAELVGLTNVTVEACGFDKCDALLAGALVVTLPSKLERVRAQLAAQSSAAAVQALRIRSVPVSLAEHLPPVGARADLLVGIASRWPEFLRFAHTMLVAAGFASEALIVRDARLPGWKDGLDEAAAVVCDVCTAKHLREGGPPVRTIVSSILDDAQPDALSPYLLCRRPGL